VAHLQDNGPVEQDIKTPFWFDALNNTGVFNCIEKENGFYAHLLDELS
jgi:hypothetical protein